MEYNLASISVSIIFVVTLLASTYYNPTLAQADLVTKTCKQTPLFQLCVSALRADPRSKTADTAVLGLIVVDALKARTKTILGQIKKLSSGSAPKIKASLSDCAELYNAVLVGDIPQAVEALTKGDPKFAEDGVVDAGMEADYCEGGFGRSKSPLTAMNKSITDLSTVARAIIRMLL